MDNSFDVVVIGGGQSGLAVGYYLRRSGLSFIILDAEEQAGGSWQHAWKSLRLFSPAQWSSLPGIVMPGGSSYYPTRDEAISYIKGYEEKYKLPVKRSVEVFQVSKHENGFNIETSDGIYISKALVSSTGSFRNPYVPDIPGNDLFKGQIIHSSEYQSSENFIGQRVAIIGEGNSGAQILAEVSLVAETVWITQKEPRFLPDHIDGRYLFDAATQMYRAKMQGRSYQPPSLGDIVMVPSVQDARERQVLKSLPAFKRFGTGSLIWDDGHEEKVNAVIFCTGFKPSLNHLIPLNIVTADGKVATEETKATAIEGIWMIGYGNWTGFASATLIGVGRSAKKTADEIQAFISQTIERQ
jgi:thioredoxin reductase